MVNMNLDGGRCEYLLRRRFGVVVDWCLCGQHRDRHGQVWWQSWRGHIRQLYPFLLFSPEAVRLLDQQPFTSPIDFCQLVLIWCLIASVLPCPLSSSGPPFPLTPHPVIFFMLQLCSTWSEDQTFVLLRPKVCTALLLQTLCCLQSLLVHLPR